MPKKEGGLGIKNIEVWKQASILNHIWNLFAKAGSLWVACVSILASFCVWTKSLKYKDAVNRDSTIQSLQVRRIQVPCHPSGRSNHPVRTPICPLCHPFGRCVYRPDLQDRSASSFWTKCSFRPDPILYREVSVPDCIRPNVSVARPDASQYSISF
jgi:hypothetical protein